MLKKGTIFLNCYATLKQYFVYDHTIVQRHPRDKSPTRTAYGYGLIYIGGKWELTKDIKYYEKDLIYDREFKAVGIIDIDNLIIKEIEKLVKSE